MRIPSLDAILIEYVSTFVPKQSGKNFNPHVQHRRCHSRYLDKMLAEPFEPFTFSPAGGAVYQLESVRLGCEKISEAWDLKH